MVVVDRPHFITKNSSLGFVYADNYKASAEVAAYLLEQGYRKFICVSGYGEVIPNARCRRDGFCDELKRHKIPDEDILIYYSDFSFEGGYNCMRQFMQDDPRAERYRSVYQQRRDGVGSHGSAEERSLPDTGGYRDRGI